jgi:SAM-dependent methyltransferase
MSNLFDSLNQRYFDSKLSATVLGMLKSLPQGSAELNTFIERMMRRMHEVGLAATDFSEVMVVQTAMVAHALPSAWNDMIPPITWASRHERIDDYLGSNPWRSAAAGMTILDVGCGFPPLTAVDTALRFPECRVIGVDPLCDHYMLYDNYGDYGCFSHDGGLRYFQAGSPDRWVQIQSDPGATRAHFADLFKRLLPRLPACAPFEVATVELDGARLIKSAMRQFERPNLSFKKGEVGALELRDVDIIRCFNVLMYFDRAFRNAALGWASRVLVPDGLFAVGIDYARSSYARYTVYQKKGDDLVPTEFAFSADLIRSVDMLCWYSLQDDDYEMELLQRVLKILRGDADFRRSFDTKMDALLVELDYGARKPDGYLGGLPPGSSYADVEARDVSIGKRLDQAGLVDDAVAVLKRAGYKAWRNSIGHIALTPPSDV